MYSRVEPGNSSFSIGLSGGLKFAIARNLFKFRLILVEIAIHNEIKRVTCVLKFDCTLHWSESAPASLTRSLFRCRHIDRLRQQN